MNRVFLSLYFLIVFSVVIVGWGADQLWKFYNPEPEASPFQQAFFDLLEHELKDLPYSETKQKSDQLGERLNLSIDIFLLEELAKTSLSQDIEQGKAVTVHDRADSVSTYKRIPDTSSVIRVRMPNAQTQSGHLYFVLLAAFYLLIALIIYFWVWPLARDLRKLQAHTQKVGDDAGEVLNLGKGSAVYSLAAAFNKMSDRISSLLASHKEMTYAVSHELRTPLARMKFALEMARDSEEAEFKQLQLDNIREDVKEMDVLITELLAYASFEQKNQNLAFKSGDLNALAEQLLALNQKAGEHKHIAYRIENELHGQQVACEWVLFERCLHNIIQNAFKYAKSQVVLRMALEGNNYLVSVEDDGQGIEKSDREKILQAFVRLRKEAEDKSGFGLGLAIVNRIMKWHHGGVRVEASDLGGAKFILYWPRG